MHSTHYSYSYGSTVLRSWAISMEAHASPRTHASPHPPLSGPCNASRPHASKMRTVGRARKGAPPMPHSPWAIPAGVTSCPAGPRCPRPRPARPRPKPCRSTRGGSRQQPSCRRRRHSRRTPDRDASAPSPPPPPPPPQEAASRCGWRAHARPLAPRPLLRRCGGATGSARTRAPTFACELTHDGAVQIRDEMTSLISQASAGPITFSSASR